jgi:hypothetical protein
MIAKDPVVRARGSFAIMKMMALDGAPGRRSSVGSAGSATAVAESGTEPGPGSMIAKDPVVRARGSLAIMKLMALDDVVIGDTDLVEG